MDFLKQAGCCLGAGFAAVTFVSGSVFGAPKEAEADLHGVANTQAEVSKPVPADKKDADTAITEDKDAELYFEVLGWMNTVQSSVQHLVLKPEWRLAYLRGATLALEGKEAPAKLGEVMEKMQAFLQKLTAEVEGKRRAETKVKAAENRQKGEAFLKSAMETNRSLKKAASGLVYEILKEGNGVKANEEDSVEIYYTGKLIDGKVFDEAKKQTVTFPLNGVIPGIKEGLQLIGEGGKATLYIPDALGYGEYDISAIPPGSLLIFEVELVKVVKSMKSATDEAATNKKTVPDEKAVAPATK